MRTDARAPAAHTHRYIHPEDKGVVQLSGFVSSREDIGTATKVARAVDGVHQLLCRHAEASHDIPVRPLLIALGHSLAETFAETARRVRLHVSADAVKLSSDRTITLALLANEAISNAYQHAFPGQRSGMIAVSFSRTGDGLVLEIRDNGVGMSRAHRPGSLGLNLMRSFAKRLSAAMSFVPVRGDTGTFVRLWIPLAITSLPEGESRFAA